MDETPFTQTLAPVFREGVLQLQPPRLLGGECVACSTRIFPQRDFCPRCMNDDSPRPVTLSDTGTVFSYTVVHQAPPGWPTPYALAFVDLDDEVRVLAQLDHPLDAIAIGLRVRLALRTRSNASGDGRTIYAFCALSPADGGGE